MSFHDCNKEIENMYNDIKNLEEFKCNNLQMTDKDIILVLERIHCVCCTEHKDTASINIYNNMESLLSKVKYFNELLEFKITLDKNVESSRKEWIADNTKLQYRQLQGEQADNNELILEYDHYLTEFIIDM